MEEIPVDEIAYRRQRARDTFHAAYGKFRSIVHGSRVRAQDPSRIQSSVPVNAIHPTAREWVIDFDVAGRRVLHGTELQVFVTHYLMGLAWDETIRSLGLSGTHALSDTCKLIAEKVGGELERKGLWPFDQYQNKLTAQAEEMDQFIREQTGQRFEQNRFVRVFRIR